jgi:hypothetical protein
MTELNETAGVQEAGATPPGPNQIRLGLLGDGKVKIEVSIEAETFYKGFDALYGLVIQLRLDADRYDKIAQVARLQALRAAQLPVPEDNVNAAIRVSADREPDSPWGVMRVVKPETG